jgi:hypothetical protein
VTLPRSRIVSAAICCNSAAFTAWGRLLIQHRDLRSQIEFLARVAAQMGEPNRAIAALQKLFSIPYAGAFPAGPLTPALLRLDPMFDPLRNDRASKNSARKSSTDPPLEQEAV